METNTNAVVQVTVTEKQKQKKISLIACLLGGFVGAHKFYEEKYFMGVLYFLTTGFMLIGVIIDLIKLIKQPAVYTVQKKHYRIDMNNLKNAIINFPVEKVGKIISIIGGGVAGLGCSMEFTVPVILIGLLVVIIGFVITWLKNRDILDTLVSNGIPAAIAAVAVFVFLLLVAFVILWIVLKLTLGIDIIEFLLDIFSDDKKKKERTQAEDQSAIFSSMSIPDHITGPYGHGYHRVSTGPYSSEFASDIDGSIVTIHDSDIDVSLAGYSADTNDGHFYW